MSNEFLDKMRWQFITLSFSKIAMDSGVAIKALGGLLELAEKSGLKFAKKKLAQGVIKSAV